MPRYLLSINGKPRPFDASVETPLLWVLRDHLALTGTKYGCGVGVCGACTVHIAGEAVRSCQVTVAEIGAKAITTIEGLTTRAEHACQKAWIAEDVAQCGYCQPGMIMQAAALLHRTPQPSDAQIDEEFAGHVCRCGTYGRIRRAVHRAASEIAG